MDYPLQLVVTVDRQITGALIRSFSLVERILIITVTGLRCANDKQKNVCVWRSNSTIYALVALKPCE
jgi:hypothetical protein